jgi:hypothetical protein
MLGDWLERAERDPSPFDQFSVVDLVEASPPVDETVEVLAAALRSARIDPDMVRDVADRIGWHRTSRLVAGAMPRYEATRRGMFGEVVAAIMLAQFEGWVVPVQKLRYAAAPDPSPPGTDIFAMYLDADGTVLSILMEEVKLRTRGASGSAIAAYRELSRASSSDFPDILAFVIERLWETDRARYVALLDYLELRKEDGADEFRITLIVENAVWSESVLEALSSLPPELEPLTASVVRISGLRDLSDRCFQALNIDDLVDDDDDVEDEIA